MAGFNSINLPSNTDSAGTPPIGTSTTTTLPAGRDSLRGRPLGFRGGKYLEAVGEDQRGSRKDYRASGRACARLLRISVGGMLW